MSETLRDPNLPLSDLPPDNLEEIGLFEFLDIDRRPIFVVDLSHPANHDCMSIEIKHLNRAFQDRELSRAIQSSPEEFRLWIIRSEADEDSNNRKLCSNPDIQWTSYTVRRKWRFICGDEVIRWEQQLSKHADLPLLQRYVAIFDLLFEKSEIL